MGKNATTALLLPELGGGITKATIACWHVNEGDLVGAEDDVVELVTDKATFHVPAGKTGTLKKILLKEGQEAQVGEVLAIIE
jgi:pyruvate/2-oxoglutarate dehydrogenase complex dihydrolipoamide acyltransferase (E2) component